MVGSEWYWHVLLPPKERKGRYYRAEDGNSEAPAEREESQAFDLMTKQKKRVSRGKTGRECFGIMERPIGIEPTPEPWQGSVLPLY
jgi:hypothetical protein